MIIWSFKSSDAKTKTRATQHSIERFFFIVTGNNEGQCFVHLVHRSLSAKLKTIIVSFGSAGRGSRA